MKERKNDQQKPKRMQWAVVAVAGVLLISNMVTAFLLLRQNFRESEATKTIQEYQFLDPAREIYRQENRIINFQPLRDYLNDTYEADPDISIYFEYLPTGANIVVTKDAEFWPASLLKVPVAMAVAKKIERGEWKWTNELVLLPSDKAIGFGDLYKKPSNSIFTIEELVRLSLAESDNTAHFILVRNLEVSEVEDVYDHMGLKGYLDTEGKISAKRYSVIFRALYNSSYLSEEYSEKILSFLTKSPFNQYIQSGLPQDTVFAHKIGVEEKRDKVLLDSGIVYAKNRPYILTAMIRAKDEEKTKELMKDISEKAYNYVSGYSGGGD